jgi:replication factor A1
VPKVNFSFVQLSELGNIEKDAVVDVLGVVKEVGEVEEIVAKTTQKPYAKRDISIVDASDGISRPTMS